MTKFKVVDIISYKSRNKPNKGKRHCVIIKPDKITNWRKELK